MTPADLAAECAHAGFTFFAGTPCSLLTGVTDAFERSPACRYLNALNEGDAVAAACGAALSGELSGVVFQNSGLGNAINPLTSLASTFEIGLLGIVSHRGAPDGEADEPQHRLMGRVTTRMLALLSIDARRVPHTRDALRRQLADARDAVRRGHSVFLLVDRATFAARAAVQPQRPTDRRRPSRTEVLVQIRAAAGGALVVCTTGKTSRELFALGDSPRHLYMVGSMGCAASLGLGLALHRPDQRVVVIDGDGALLMRMNNLALVGQHRPSNLTHIVLDNGVHDSTGGQPSLSTGVDLVSVAAGCGYRTATEVQPPDRLALPTDRALSTPGPHFMRVHIRPGSPAGLGRPTISPAQVAARLSNRRASGG